ncbi:MAG TPA: ribonuclease D, partial [Steroidobacteraceae bacterium]|nr:ribonuclease D [Steroidobacteraceae bacterium]
MSQPEQMISEPQGLAALAARLAIAPAVGLDTEFLRERTYRAELCLLQLADAHGPVCVDPLALAQLAPLGAVLGAGGPVKVMHACRQDIEVLLPAVGMVQPVFDTQIAAALAGMPAQVGYAELVRRILGRDLSKAHTRTDWSRRPLSAEQLDYALDDVRYLPALREHLLAELGRMGRLEWLAEELAGLACAAAYAVDPESAWQKVRSLRGLDPDRARLAQMLAAWRERRAAERNRPRGWILDDGALREIVLRAPHTAEDLAAVRELPAGFIKHSGAQILALVHSAAVPAQLPRPPRRGAPDPARTAAARKLGAVLQAAAGELALSPEILATRRDLEALA